MLLLVGRVAAAEEKKDFGEDLEIDTKADSSTSLSHPQWCFPNCPLLNEKQCGSFLFESENAVL